MTSARFATKVLLVASAAIVAFLTWYSIVLLGRTRFLAQATSLASPTILGFHALGVTAAVIAAFAARGLRSRYGWIVFGAACVVEGAFLLSNLVGIVWEYQKEGPASLFQAIVQLIQQRSR